MHHACTHARTHGCTYIPHAHTYTHARTHIARMHARMHAPPHTHAHGTGDATAAEAGRCARAARSDRKKSRCRQMRAHTHARMGWHACTYALHAHSHTRVDLFIAGWAEGASGSLRVLRAASTAAITTSAATSSKTGVSSLEMWMPITIVTSIARACMHACMHASACINVHACHVHGMACKAILFFRLPVLLSNDNRPLWF